MTKVFYCCSTDWRYEMGEAPDLEGKMPLYSSLEQLKEMRKCWEERGITEVTLTAKELQRGTI